MTLALVVEVELGLQLLLMPLQQLTQVVVEEDLTAVDQLNLEEQEAEVLVEWEQVLQRLLEDVIPVAVAVEAQEQDQPATKLVELVVQA